MRITKAKLRSLVEQAMSGDGSRPIHEIASEIDMLWPKVSRDAVPYLDAMFSLNSITDRYGADYADSIVMYFLSNASSWKGPDAKRIKTELKQLLKKAK